MKKTLEKWLDFHFSTGCETGSDYIQFQKEARADLKKKVAQANCSIVEFNKNHYEFSAVLENEATGKLIYMSIPDVRFWENQWYTNVLYRRMKDRNDYSGRGDYNHYTAWNNLPNALMGIVRD